MRTLHVLSVLLTLGTAGMAVGQDRYDRDRYERAAKIDGAWYLSGDRDQPCYVEQSGRDRRPVFTNERGEAAYGTIVGRRVRVPEWDDPSRGGLHGQVRDDLILWNNGTYWTRRPIF